MPNIKRENRVKQIRLTPPPDLTDPEKEIWHRVVNSVPEFHFDARHSDLIRRFVAMSYQLIEGTNWEREQLDKFGHDGLYHINPTSGVMKLHPIAARNSTLSYEIQALALKLRLLPVARRSEESKAQAEEDAAFESAKKDAEKVYGDSLLFDA